MGLMACLGLSNARAVPFNEMGVYEMFKFFDKYNENIIKRYHILHILLNLIWKAILFTVIYTTLNTIELSFV